MVAVGVFDTLQLSSRNDGQLELSNHSGFACAGQSLGDVPSGPQNIIVRALEKLRIKAGIALGASVRLTKRIASAAGLGGASSDAAAILLLANEAWQLGWTREQLSEVAAELGSDIPFFLGAPAAICGAPSAVLDASVVPAGFAASAPAAAAAPVAPTAPLASAPDFSPSFSIPVIGAGSFAPRCARSCPFPRMMIAAMPATTAKTAMVMRVRRIFGFIGG